VVALSGSHDDSSPVQNRPGVCPGTASTRGGGELTLAPLDPRIPDWGQGTFVDRVCPFCGTPPSGIDAVTRPDGLVVNDCTCGARFVSPAPSSDALNTFYAAYAKHARWVPAGANRDRTMRAADPLSDYRTRRLASMMDFQGARVLDVGFGQGADLVRYSQLGADAHGVDLDGESVRFARDYLGVEAFQGDIANYSPGVPFDLVSLHDVIEHPLEPLTLLQECARHVRQGGLLSMWTPNGDELDRNPEQVALRVDLEHMQYLGKDTILRLADVLGWHVEHLEAVGLPALDSFTADPGSPIKAAIKRVIPRRLLRWRAERREDLRRWCSGTYHLFAVLRRPSIGA